MGFALWGGGCEGGLLFFLSFFLDGWVAEEGGEGGGGGYGEEAKSGSYK